MTITPRRPTSNVNVGRQHPLAELAWLLGGSLVVLAALYLVIGWSVEWAVTRMPPELEQSIAERLSASVATPDDRAEAETPRRVLSTLLAQAPELRAVRDFSLSVSDSPDINAFALPGGQIVVLRGLLDAVESENELAMVLGHELGHYAGRDHLRRIGRSLVLAVISTLILGAQSDLTQWLYGTVSLAEARFNREQELAADAYGLALLQAAYGHVGGSTAFFSRLDAAGDHLPAWARTHPHGKTRVQRLQNLAAEQGWPSQAVTPLPVVAD